MGNIGESLKRGGNKFLKKQFVECCFNCSTCNKYQNFVLLLSNTNYTSRFKLLYVLN